MVLGRYYCQRGFALPIAIMLGLMFMVIGASVLVRSQSDNATASAQRGTMRGLNAAEIGVGRIQSLMNQYRGIATYPAFGPTQSWQNPTTLTTPSSGCFGASAAAAVPAMAATTWVPVDPNDANKGQYRLVNYTYDSSQKQGTLVVEGQNGSSLNPAITRLEVKIPVLATAETIPGLWVKDSLQAGSGTKNASIWGPCSGTFVAPTKGNFTLKKTALAMPNPPAPPSLTPLVLTPGITLPQPVDTANASGVYEYVVADITDDLNLTPGKKINIWVTGNIDLPDNKTIKHPCSTATPCSPFDVKIYGTSGSGTLTLNGDAAICDVMVWAPTYSVNLKGKSAPRCDGGDHNNGIYWVKSWSDNGSGNHIALDQSAAIWDDAPIPPPAKISPIASWRREQTN